MAELVLGLGTISQHLTVEVCSRPRSAAAGLGPVLVAAKSPPRHSQPLQLRRGILPDQPIRLLRSFALQQPCDEIINRHSKLSNKQSKNGLTLRGTVPLFSNMKPSIGDSRLCVCSLQ